MSATYIEGEFRNAFICPDMDEVRAIFKVFLDGSEDCARVFADHAEAVEFAETYVESGKS